MLFTILLSKLRDIYYGLPALLWLTSNPGLCIFAAPAYLEFPSNHQAPPLAISRRQPATSRRHRPPAPRHRPPAPRHRPPADPHPRGFIASPTATGHLFIKLYL
ncbi:hypothetical protein NG798_27325 [Ancylothrix sp. C2]|uniref:hypothetical protein n=1 Tax=Ancylothrix sp. D3o TaxID=2953691 RepID=UPI0021BB2A8F|nr:hypothetical protein [Ancylothrix sp. D3o]MCT7953512.1 hypothetical protein [Ancylothrix sp. D3o]